MKKKAKIGDIVTITTMIVAVITITFSAVLFVLSANQQRASASLTVTYVATNVYVEVDAKYQCKEDATPTGLSGGPLTFEATSASTTGTLAAGDIVLSPTNNYVLFTYSFRNKATSGAYDIMVSMSDNVNKANTKVYYAYNDTSTAMSTMASTMTSTRTTTAPQNISIPAQQKWYMYVYVEIADPYFGASYTSDASHFISFNIHNTNFVAGMLDDYQQVEYIQSSGTQWIDTGANAEYNYSFDIKYQFLETSSTQVMMGKRYPWFSVACYQGYFNFSYSTTYNDEIIYRIQEIDTSAHTLQLKGNSLIFDGETKTTIPRAEFYSICDNTLYLFARNYNGNKAEREYWTTGRLYYYKLYDQNGTIIRDFIPCYRKSDNVAGLYDVCTNTFFTNQGTGSFTCGADLNVPREYTEVEYIESTGTQYIDTGVAVSRTENAQLIITMQFMSTGERQWAGANAYLQFNYGYFETTDKINIDISYNTSNDETERIIMNGTTESYSHNWSHIEQVDSKIGIFRLGSYNNTWYLDENSLQIARTYSYTIIKNDTLVRNFVPCYRNSDHEAGLYDTVEGKFYTNQGTGSFQKGLDVSAMSTYQQVEYIESTGEQYIDTGVLPYKYMKAYADYTAVAGSSEGSADVISFGAGDGATRSCGLPGHNANYMWYTQGGAEFVYKQNNPTYSAGSRYKITSELTPTTMSITVNGNYVSRNATTDVDFPYTIYAFASNHAGTVKYKCSIKLHSYVMWRDGAIARDFVPVYRKSDNEAGLYDTVNKKFYTNIGTGDFILPS